MQGIELVLPALILTAYLLGSLPTAILVCHSMGIRDPRQQGSGNPGTSNVLRVGNRLAALFTLIGDMGKGILATLPAIWLQLPVLEQGFCAAAALLGHIYPLYTRFQGGKGVATFFGCCLALHWPTGILQVIFWLLMFSVGRIASLASISTALVTPLFVWLLAPQLMGMICLMGIILMLTHRENIEKLLAGEESRF
ncbi:glycerol-3-phosphate 1-O-acyltransferase PlsY [Marinobacterium jannaschii]|uniref:glycerol-3-phosphate 1-O-acyltransferase PlsY n=1 Tax=Marinobacterium jannaschii TaxID=64970 RepID=UPI000488017D|nr:glycerol-3-phosphate 1-O-acyltransferase PlsY [Marinobacterium jannaschii]